MFWVPCRTLCGKGSTLNPKEFYLEPKAFYLKPKKGSSKGSHMRAAKEPF
jgi:hypothetical protein